MYHKMEKNKLNGLVILVSLLLVLTSLNVSAFGVSASYWKGRPLAMGIGETRDVNFRLQNMVGDEEVYIKVELLEDKNFVELIDDSDTYHLPPKTRGVKVNLRVTIPKGTQVGTMFKVKASFTTAAKPGESGGVKFGTGITKSFDVVVGDGGVPIKEEVKEEVPTKEKRIQEGMKSTLTKKDLVPALIILIIILLVWLWIQKNKMKKMRRRERKYGLW